MAKKQFYIQQVKPVEEVELKLEGSKDQAIIVGFKVHGIKERKLINEALYTQEYTTALLTIQALEEQRKLNTEVSEEASKAYIEAITKFSEEHSLYEVRVLEQLKADIAYFKNVTVTDYNELGVKTFSHLVKDTRTVELSETTKDYWETTEECLQSLLSVLLDNKSWLDTIQEAYTEFTQKDIKELQAKN